MHENLPPPPKDESKSPWVRTFLAYVWDIGGDYIEHGKGVRKGEAKHHMLKMDLGADAGVVVELRVVGDFTVTEKSYTVMAKVDGEEVPAGSAPLHEDGKGYQLRLSRPVADGEVLKLVSDGPLPSSGDRKFGRRPNPALKRKAWA